LPELHLKSCTHRRDQYADRRCPGLCAEALGWSVTAPSTSLFLCAGSRWPSDLLTVVRSHDAAVVSSRSIVGDQRSDSLRCCFDIGQFFVAVGRRRTDGGSGSFLRLTRTNRLQCCRSCQAANGAAPVAASVPRAKDLELVPQVDHTICRGLCSVQCRRGPLRPREATQQNVRSTSDSDRSN